MATQTTLVAASFDDEIRAEEAATALRVFGGAHRELGVRAPWVIVRRTSGAVSTRKHGRVQGRSGAVTGLVLGAALLGLPAAGAAAMVAWLLGTFVFTLVQLFGVVSSDQAGLLVTSLTVGAGVLGALIAGVIGGALGALLGWLIGLLVARLRGYPQSQVTTMYGRLEPGSAAVVTQARTEAMPVVDAELARLGGTPRQDLLPAPAPVEPAADRSTDR